MLEYRKRIYDNYVSLWQGGRNAFDESAARNWSISYDYFLRNLLPKNPGAAILDVACGSGNLLYFLKSKGFTNVKGVDVSPEQVALARQVMQDVVQQDAVEYLKSHPGEFDLIIGLDIIEHFAKDEVLVFLNACRDAVRPNGRIVLQTPNSAALMGAAVQFGDLTHELGLTPECLENLLRITGFTAYEARECGPTPHGLMSTVRFVLWQFIRGTLALFDLVEVGGRAHNVYTRVFIGTAVKT